MKVLCVAFLYLQFVVVDFGVVKEFGAKKAACKRLLKATTGLVC